MRVCPARVCAVRDSRTISQCWPCRQQAGDYGEESDGGLYDTDENTMAGARTYT